MTTTDDILPRWLSTKEAAFRVALWLMRQDDRALHHMRILAELAEVTGDLREAFLKPPWQTRPGAHLEAARRDQYCPRRPATPEIPPPR
jgi:hypothetical protein